MGERKARRESRNTAESDSGRSLGVEHQGRVRRGRSRCVSACHPPPPEHEPHLAGPGVSTWRIWQTA